MNMDIDNCNSVVKNQRGRSVFSSTKTSRSVSIVSNASFIEYHLKIEQNNNLPNKMTVDLADCSWLSDNKKEGGEDNLGSKMANPNITKEQ